MLKLWLDSHQLRIDNERCRTMLDTSHKWPNTSFVYGLDSTYRPNKTYKTPGPVFFFRNKGYKVAKKQIPKLLAALEQATTQDVEFQIGFRPISSTGYVRTMEIPETTL